MAGCVSCFILPLLLFLFHRFIQPILLKYFNPWEKKPIAQEVNCTESCNEENKLNAANSNKVATENGVERLKSD